MNNDYEISIDSTESTSDKSVLRQFSSSNQGVTVSLDEYESDDAPPLPPVPESDDDDD